jgi:ribosome-binding factor A
MPSRRQRQVSELIHRELSILLMREVRDPRLANLTITGVDVTPDLMLSKIYFTVLGEEDAEQEAIVGLERAKGFLRTQLAGRVQLRYMPELVFELDKSIEYGNRIDDLLSQIAESEQVGDEPEAA